MWVYIYLINIMPSAKVKQISLDVFVLPKVHNLSVSVTIPFWCSPECVAILWGNNPCESDEGRCNTLHKGSEEAALAFALFSHIREKLSGSPLEVARCKVDHVTCGAHDNEFVVAWNTQGTGSALRKTIGVVLKCLAPNALFSRYSNNIKVLGGKVDRAVFNYLANKMIDGINKSIEFVAVGKIKADADFKELLSVAANKYSASSKSGAGDTQAPETHSDHKGEFPLLTCTNGSAAIVVADYIHHQGFGLRLCGRHITIFTKAWGSKHDALKKKDRINGYVAAKYEKLDKLAGLFMAYRANSAAMGSASAISGIAKNTKPGEYLSKNL
jgi:hypothetical protein